MLFTFLGALFNIPENATALSSSISISSLLPPSREKIDADVAGDLCSPVILIFCIGPVCSNRSKIPTFFVSLSAYTIKV